MRKKEKGLLSLILSLYFNLIYIFHIRNNNSIFEYSNG